MNSFPSLDDLHSIMKNEYVFSNEMRLIVSKPNISSIQSIENMDLDHRQPYPDEPASIEHIHDPE